MELTKKANAKINLSLDLTGVLPNGYHAINTVMQSVSLCDTVTLRPGGEGIGLSCSDVAVPVDGRNTAFRAAALFYGAISQPPAVSIHIEKRIPSQAGLGGGSADAAAVLLALNELHGAPLSMQTLLALGLKIGADVPFTLLGGTRLCLNVGEVTAPLPPVRAHAVIAKPQGGVSTAAAFGRYDAGAPLTHPKADPLLFYLAAGDHETALKYACNVFEELTDIPEGSAVKQALYKNGAYYAALSGSGSAYFGLFGSADEAERAAAAARELVPFVYVCETVNSGVEDA